MSTQPAAGTPARAGQPAEYYQSHMTPVESYMTNGIKVFVIFGALFAIFRTIIIVHYQIVWDGWMQYILLFIAGFIAFGGTKRRKLGINQIAVERQYGTIPQNAKIVTNGDFLTDVKLFGFEIQSCVEFYAGPYSFDLILTGITKGTGKEPGITVNISIRYNFFISNPIMFAGFVEGIEYIRKNSETEFNKAVAIYLTGRTFNQTQAKGSVAAFQELLIATIRGLGTKDDLSAPDWAITYTGVSVDSDFIPNDVEILKSMSRAWVTNNAIAIRKSLQKAGKPGEITSEQAHNQYLEINELLTKVVVDGNSGDFTKSKAVEAALKQRNEKRGGTK